MTEEKVGRPLLEIKELVKRFGGVLALQSLSFEVEKNTILGIVGPNGSGKTTLFNTIMGFHKSDAGDVCFKGESLLKLRPYQVARRGIGMTFQLTRMFRKMTVLENLLAASRDIDRALELLDFVKLTNLKDTGAANLSYGQQRLVELARVLMREPELVMLDEPTGGVNPVLVEQIIEHIRRLKHEYNKTILIIEHNMPVVFRVCDRVIVLDHGEKISEGTPNEVISDRKVVDAYLGRA